MLRLVGLNTGRILHLLGRGHSTRTRHAFAALPRRPLFLLAYHNVDLGLRHFSSGLPKRKKALLQLLNDTDCGDLVHMLDVILEPSMSKVAGARDKHSFIEDP